MKFHEFRALTLF